MLVRCRAPLVDTDPSLVEAVDVAAALGTDPDHGLTAAEAARRLASTGPNEIAAAKPVPTWRKLLEQFRDPLIYLLLVAIAVSLVAWLVEGASGWPFDAIVIAVIVVLNAVLGYVQQAKAEHAVEALQRLSATTATVVRDGVHAAGAHPRPGPRRPTAPGRGRHRGRRRRLLSAATLKVSEASLTGESEPVLKDARTLPEPAALGDRLDMVFNGTAVTQGVGRAVVTATGMATQMGQIAGLLHATREDPTPLQREIARVGRMLGIAVVVIAVVVIATIFLFFGVEQRRRRRHGPAARGLAGRRRRARGAARHPLRRPRARACSGWRTTTRSSRSSPRWRRSARPRWSARTRPGP